MRDILKTLIEFYSILRKSTKSQETSNISKIKEHASTKINLL